MQADDRNEIDNAITALLHPASRKLFRYWEGLRAARALPERDEISLRQLAPLLRNMSILEKSASGIWQYRLAGSGVVELMQQSMTGMDALLGFDDSARKEISHALDYAQNQLQPCLVRMRLIYMDDSREVAELLILPVNDKNLGQVMLWGGLFGFGNNRGSVGVELLRRELILNRTIWTEHKKAGREKDAFPHLRVIQGGLLSSER